MPRETDASYPSTDITDSFFCAHLIQNEKKYTSKMCVIVEHYVSLLDNIMSVQNSDIKVSRGTSPHNTIVFTLELALCNTGRCIEHQYQGRLACTTRASPPTGVFKKWVLLRTTSLHRVRD